jgi:hypothetical protein
MCKVIAGLLICVLNIGLAYAELGKGSFDPEPSSNPIQSSDSSFANTRYWSCAGHINPQLQKTMLGDLEVLSDNNKLQKPGNYCVYKILKIKSQNKVVYGADYFLSQAAMDKCMKNDVCEETRSVSFPFVNGKLYRSYFLKSNAKGTTANACLTIQGDVVSMTKACE